MTTQDSTISSNEAQQQLAEFSQTIFPELQQDFHELNHEISKDSPLEPFRHEYAKLFGILQKSMTNQARYIEKGRVIESEISGNKARVRIVSKLAEEDARSISNLNDERDKKQAILTESLANLREAMEQNDLITSEIVGFENELERCIMDEKGQKDELNQLRQRRSELTKKYEDLSQQIPQLQDNNKSIEDKKVQREKDISESLDELKRNEELVDSKVKEDQEERQRLFELERDREATRSRLKDTQQRVKDRLTEVSQEQEAVKQIEKKVKEQKRRFESSKAEKQEAAERCSKFQKELDQLNQSISSIEQGINDGRKLLDERQEVANQLKKQVSSLESERDKIRQKLQGLQERFEILRKECDSLRSQVDSTEGRIDVLRREGELIRKQIDSCVREENAKLKKKEGEAQRQNLSQTILQLYKNQAHNIECEISIIKAHLQETQKKIFSIDSDRERYSEELSSATSHFLHAQEILKENENKLAKMMTEISEGDKRVLQQQALFEKVRAEREVFSKRVKEVQNEINELESNFDRLKFAIEQHKEDIRRKDIEKETDLHELSRLEQEDGRLREKLVEVEITIATANSAIIANEAEVSKINVAIKAAESELASEEQKLSQVKKERDHMSNKNVECELEMREVDQKLQILMKQRKRGMKDFETKQLEIDRLSALIENDMDKLKKIGEIDNQLIERREKVHSLQKELLQLRAERAAMEEELSIPINIHRWTLLESSDPIRFEKLKRYQELQADLIARTKEVNDLQEKIKQKEIEYSELSSQLKRKPGIEVEQKVNEYAEKCKSESYSLDQITSQLEMYRDVVKEYRKEVSDVQIELLNERNKWIRQKKKDIKNMKLLKEQNDILQEMDIKLSEPI